MKKSVAIGLIALFAILGVIVGNLYGRRDVINSRPPVVSGPVGQPSLLSTGLPTGTTTAQVPQYNLFRPVLLYNPAKTATYGAVSFLVSGDKTELILTLYKLPTLDAAAQAKSYVLALYGADGKKIADIAAVDLKAAAPVVVKATTGVVQAGQYFAVVATDSGTAVMTSVKVE